MLCIVWLDGIGAPSCEVQKVRWAISLWSRNRQTELRESQQAYPQCHNPLSPLQNEQHVQQRAIGVSGLAAFTQSNLG